MITEEEFKELGFYTLDTANHGEVYFRNHTGLAYEKKHPTMWSFRLSVEQTANDYWEICAGSFNSYFGLRRFWGELKTKEELQEIVLFIERPYNKR